MGNIYDTLVIHGNTKLIGRIETNGIQLIRNNIFIP